MVERPTGIGILSALMAIVGACDGVAQYKGAQHSAVRHRTGESTITHLFELAVPLRSHGNPHFNSDIGILSGFGRCTHTAISNLGRTLGRRLLSAGHDSVGKFHRGKLAAVLRTP